MKNEEIQEFLKTIRSTIAQLDIMTAINLNQDESELILNSVKALQTSINNHIGEKIIE